MKHRTRAIALGGITAALTFVLCWVGSVSNSARFIMPGVCGILLTVILRQTSPKVAWAVYGVSSVMLLLLPNRISAYAYILLLGYYPVLCEGLRKKVLWLRLTLKPLLLTAVGCLVLFVGAAAMGLGENPQFRKYYPVMILLYYVLAGIYEGFLWLLRRRFDGGWDQKLKKLLR